MVVSRDRDVVLDGRVPLRAWYPVEVLRFPLRSLEQAERRAQGRSGPSEPRSRIEQELLEANVLGALRDRWTELVVDDDELERRVSDGSLVVDERLRDALRKLRKQPRGARPLGILHFPSRDPATSRCGRPAWSRMSRMRRVCCSARGRLRAFAG